MNEATTVLLIALYAIAGIFCAYMGRRAAADRSTDPFLVGTFVLAIAAMWPVFLILGGLTLLGEWANREAADRS
jgi:hypothetical protein